jgi:hypothetical protein
MMGAKQSAEWLAKETEVIGENLLQCPTWSDLGSNLGRRSAKQKTKRLSYGTEKAKDLLRLRNVEKNMQTFMLAI